MLLSEDTDSNDTAKEEKEGVDEVNGGGNIYDNYDRQFESTDTAGQLMFIGDRRPINDGGGTLMLLSEENDLILEEDTFKAGALTVTNKR